MANISFWARCACLLVIVLTCRAQSQCDGSKTRNDCGHVGTTQATCEASGCCWVPATAAHSDDTPWCFYPNAGPVPTPAPGSPPYSPADGMQLIEYFLQNVDYQSSGATVAAPSNNHPDYFYHWVRDSAITMNLVLKLDNGTSPIPADKVDSILQNYVSWVANAQQQPDPNAGFNTLGEPKFYLSGKIFDKPWGRPQNDGPGLRARALSNFAMRVLDGKTPGGVGYVTEKLYHPGVSTLPIAADLQYVINSWKDDSFDLWEEVNGQHFFTKMAQRKALYTGAQLARRLNDTSTASAWEAAARAIEPAIDAHWNAGTGVLQETLTPHPGPQKYNELDCAVVLAAIEGDTGDGFYGPTAERVLATAAALEDSMAGVYPINAADDSRGVPGFLIGRYPNDTFDGYETGSVGNPWFLCTHAMGELYYHQAHEAITSGRVEATALSARFLRRAHDALVPGAVVDYSTTAGNAGGLPDLPTLAAALIKQGDAYLERTHYHAAGRQLHFSEQINRDTGFEQGAPDLTWSYATALSALNVRGHVFNALQQRGWA